MDNGSPALFRRGLPAGVRLVFFASLSIILMLVDGKLKTLESFRAAIDSYLLRPAVAVSEGVGRSFHGIGQFFTTVEELTAENEKLKKKNAELSFALSEFEKLKAENSQLQALAGVKTQIRRSAAIGIVKGETADVFSKRIEINIGKNSGIEPGMPVIDENGVIGQVARVSADRSEVTLLTDPAMQFPVYLPRSGIRCATSYTQSDQTVELQFVPAVADIQEGDAVQTSGIDGVFPPGIPVGKVTHVEKIRGDAFAHVWVRLSASPSFGRYVMVALVNVDPGHSAGTAQTEKAAP